MVNWHPVMEPFGIRWKVQVYIFCNFGDLGWLDFLELFKVYKFRNGFAEQSCDVPKKTHMYKLGLQKMLVHKKP